MEVHIYVNLSKSLSGIQSRQALSLSVALKLQSGRIPGCSTLSLIALRLLSSSCCPARSEGPREVNRSTALYGLWAGDAGLLHEGQQRTLAPATCSRA